jgi:predicted Na+-dependent transporter
LSNDVSLDFVGIIISALLVVAGLGCGIYIKNWTAKPGNVERGKTVLNVVAKLGTLGGLGTVLFSIVANAQSDTPIYGAPGAIYAATFVQVVCGISLGFGIANLIGLRKPSCVAVSVETSVQNAILCMAIIGISFDEDDAGAAAVVPMCYMFFSTWTNVVWAVLSWKVLGFSDLPTDSTFADMMKSYKESFSNEQTGEPRENMECVVVGNPVQPP